jgi:protocatechuate 3,4-dioxygenase beta subunit
MSSTTKLSRRSILTAGAGIAASAIAATTLANPNAPTPANPEGPFYPKHQQVDKDTDLTTAPRDPNFQGWGMVQTDADGNYSFTTIKPGAYPVGDGWSRPPHIHYKVSRRGYHELTTQMYFADEPLNEKDNLLLSVEEGDRAALIVSFQDTDGIQSGHFPIVLAKVVA